MFLENFQCVPEKFVISKMKRKKTLLLPFSLFRKRMCHIKMFCNGTEKKKLRTALQCHEQQHYNELFYFTKQNIS